MQSLLGPRPIRPLSQRSPSLIGGLSAFWINSQIIRLQHSLLSFLQSLFLLVGCFLFFLQLLPLSFHTAHSFIAACPSGVSLLLCKITVFILCSSTMLAPSFPLLLASSSDFFSSEFTFLLPYLFLLCRSYTHTLFCWVMIGWCYCVSVCEEATPPSVVLSTLSRCLVLQPQYDGHHFKGMLRGCECMRKREKDLLYL